MSQLLEIITKTLSDKQAEKITIIDMRSVNPYSDYYVVCTARNSRHAATLADYVEEAAAKAGYPARVTEGDRNSDWILADLNEVVVHIFTEEARSRYRLEALWADMPQQTIEVNNVASI